MQIARRASHHEGLIQYRRTLLLLDFLPCAKKTGCSLEPQADNQLNRNRRWRSR